MNVSTDSWHYKIAYNKHVRTSKSIPANLCNYFWFVAVYVIFKILVPISVSILYIIGLYIMSNYDFNELSVLSQSVYVISVSINALIAFMIFMVIVITVVNCIIKGIEYTFNKITNKTKRCKEPNLVVEYIRAKKQRVCPMIKFTNKGSKK